MLSTTQIPFVGAVRGWRSEWHQRWRQASPTTRTRIQVSVFLGSVFVAYHYSLSTLLQTLSVDTPLAYIGLVPPIALGLAAVRSSARAPEPQIHDRQVDYIVAVPLVTAALAINLLLPRRLSAMFWVWRIDLLSFPFFVAGVAAIIFGVRALWRQRLAVAFLFLAWPVPYSVLLLRDLNGFTSMTLGAVRALVGITHVAVRVPYSDGSLFQVAHHGQVFSLSVVSACTGVNGMVGFLLVGAAFGAIVTGPRLRKWLWLVGGIGLLWFINLARLLFIFWAGSQFGRHVAIDVLHPFVGLITFNIGVFVMLLMMKPFGLHLGRPSAASGSRVPRERPASEPVPGSPPAPSTVLAVPAVFSAVALVAAASVFLGLTNSNLRAYDLVAKANGEPRLSSYLNYPASPQGWRASFITHYDWAKPYFGEASNWYRYVYTATLGGDLHSTFPVTADVVNTNKLDSFSAYGVEACYKFHGYSLKNLTQVNLGGGITGETLSYSAVGNQDWTIVYWIWPVNMGSSVRYERVILYLLNTEGGSVSGPGVSGVTNLQGSLDPTTQFGLRLKSRRDFLVSFAREIVNAQTGVRLGAQLPLEQDNASTGPRRPRVVNPSYKYPVLGY